MSNQDLDHDAWRLFVATALLVGATAGFTFGVALVLGITTQLWTSGWLSFAQVHGHAQVWGWLLLLSAGILLQVLPRANTAPVSWKRWWLPIFVLLLAGLLARTIGQPLAAVEPFGLIFLLAGPLQVAGVTLVVIAAERLRRANLQVPSPLERWLPSALIWLWLGTVMEAVAAAPAALAGAVVVAGAWHEAALAALLWGYATLLIGGISLRSFEHMLSLPAPGRRAGSAALVAIHLGVAGAVAAPLVAAAGDGGTSLALRIVAGVALPVGSLLLAHSLSLCPLGQLRTPFAPGMSSFGAFIRVSYLWLVVAALMVLLEAVAWLTGEGLGYFAVNATRHALTLGFITMMIFGMAGRLVPMFSGQPWYSDRLHWLTFGLLNLSVAGRVLLQPGPGYAGAPILLGLGAGLGLASFVVFAVNVVLTLRGAGRPVPRPQAIAISSLVADVVRAYPATREVFRQRGLRAIAERNYLERRARITTVGQAAFDYQMDPGELLVALRRTAAGESVPPPAAARLPQPG